MTEDVKWRGEDEKKQTFVFFFISILDQYIAMDIPAEENEVMLVFGY